MVNTLSGSVCAYRKETVKPRFIRIDEVMALLDVTQDEAMDIALAAGARYQLAKIILVHKERLMKFMKHSARVPSSNKIVEKKFVRIGEGSMTYSIGHHRWEILQSVPDGQKSSYLVQVILKDQENNQLEKSIRQAIREELAGVSISGSGERVSKKEEIPSQMLDFLSGLEDAF